MQAEYGRLSDESKQLQGGAATNLDAEMQTCREALRKAEGDRDAAAEKLAAAEKARRTAEKNADALLTQTKVCQPVTFVSLQLMLHIYMARHASLPELSALNAQGLENEYDRLLSSHDELQRRLSRLDPVDIDRTYGSVSKED